MFLPLAIGAGLGLLKGATIDKSKEKRQRKLQAETTRYSPWTGMQGEAPKEADMLGSALSYGMTAHQIGQGAKQQAMMDDYLAQQSQMGGNPWSGLTPMEMDALSKYTMAGGNYGVA